MVQHYIAQFREQYGERGTLARITVELDDDADPNATIEGYLDTYWGDDTEEVERLWKSPDGAAAVAFTNLKPITPEEYEVLSEYLVDITSDVA